MTSATTSRRAYERIEIPGAHGAYWVDAGGRRLGLVACEKHGGPWWAQRCGDLEERDLFVSRRAAAQWLEEEVQRD